MIGETLHVQNLRKSKMQSSLFSIVILAYWDNVMGPMISKIWTGNDDVENSEEIINYVANHTLSGELCRQTEKHTIDPKLCILPDLGYIFNAYIFNGHSKMGSTITSLSFVMPYKEMSRYLLLQDFMEKQVKLIVLKYRIFQQKDLNTSIKQFAKYLRELVNTVDTLTEMSIRKNICVEDTIFGEVQTSNSADLLDSAFLMRVLTSHFQTHGCTIVTGRTSQKVNLLIDALSLFQTDKERYCSRVAFDGTQQKKFAQDLWLQGLVCDGGDDALEQLISTKEALLNTYPVTLINVDEKLVRQMVCANVYAIKRRDNLIHECSMLLYGQPIPSFPINNVFTDDFGDIATSVERFITELFLIPNNCNIRRNHIENFKHVLRRKALTLLSYTESKSNSGRNILDEIQLERMKQDLCLSSESDFRMVLATAEKIRPGISMFLVKAIENSDNRFQDDMVMVRFKY